MKKHYLFLMDTTGIGGAERVLIDYFKFINYSRYAVTWAVKQEEVKQGTLSEYLGKNNLPVKVVQLPISAKDKIGSFKKFIKYYYFLKKNKPHCIIFSQFWLKSFSLPELFAAFIIAKGNTYMFVHDCAPIHRKYDSKFHFGILPGIGLDWRKERFLQRALVYFTKSTIAVSKSVMDSLSKFHKYPFKKIKLVYHGVDIQKFAPSLDHRIKFRNNFGIAETDNIIISTARLDKIKRLDRLIEAFAYLAQQRQDIQLILVGIGPKYDELRSMVDSLDADIQKRIKFLGFQNDIAPILQASDIYVLPSDSEGFGLACLEAMSSGLIPVVTTCGGVVEMIRDGWSGFLVEKSTKGIIDGIKKALSLTNEERKEISQNARKSIIENFNLKDRVEYALRILDMNL